MVIYFTIQKGEKIDQQLAFQSKAQSTVHSIENELHNLTNALYSLGDFVQLSDNLTRKQFGQFSQNHLARYPSILSFSWAPFISSEQRSSFINILINEGFSNADIRMMTQSGQLISDDERGYYFPVYYVEPFDSLSSQLGYNLASESLRHQALKNAFDQNSISVTEKLTLVLQEKTITGLLVILPIDKKTIAKAGSEIIKRGGLVEAINLEALISYVLTPVNVDKSHLILIDNEASDGNQLLYDSKGHNPSVKKLNHYLIEQQKSSTWQQTIRFANRNYTVIIQPNQALTAFNLLSLPWLSFITGLILTAIFCFYWLNRHHSTIETVVRAQQFSKTNKNLSEEIVERLKIEKKLIKFAHAFQLSADGINLLNMEGDYTYCNQASIDLYGYKLDQMHNLHYSDINQDPSIKELNLLSQVKEQGAWHGEFAQTRRDGTKFPASISLSLIKDDTGSHIGFLEITRDITETNLLEAELQQSRKMEALGTLAGGIAHDFNNILASILGNSEMILMSKIEPVKTQGYISNIQEGCNRAADLVKQIMTFSRMETMQLNTLDLAKAVNNALTIIRATLPANIHINSSINPYCAPIKGDETQIHQILLNLCANASQAIGDEGGTIAIDLHQEHTLSYEQQDITKEKIQLSITDTGKGISSENITKIFDPFFTTKKIGEGTGLGLAVVKSIIESHDGEIVVKSELNQGASFVITFPTCHDENEIIPEPEPEKIIEIVKQPESSGKHVLIVEDEPHISRLYQEFIKEYGYQTTVCEDGKQALAVFDDPNTCIDLVLTDQAMPNVTGKDLSIILLNKQPKLPIIMCTGYSEVINEDLAKDIGIRKYFLKPASLTKLMEAIDQLLKE